MDPYETASSIAKLATTLADEVKSQRARLGMEDTLRETLRAIAALVGLSDNVTVTVLRAAVADRMQELERYKTEREGSTKVPEIFSKEDMKDADAV